MWPSIFLLLPLSLQGQETCDTETGGQCSHPEESMLLEELGNRPAGVEDVEQILNELVLQMFNAADDNFDGLLDVEETEDLAKGFEITYPEMKLGIMDEDGDGYATLPEVQQCVQKAFFPELLRQIHEQKGSFLDEEDGPVPLREEPIINRDGVVIRW